MSEQHCVFPWSFSFSRGSGCGSLSQRGCQGREARPGLFFCSNIITRCLKVKATKFSNLLPEHQWAPYCCEGDSLIFLCHCHLL